MKKKLTTLIIIIFIMLTAGHVYNDTLVSEYKKRKF